jgi:hypothetical protein
METELPSGGVRALLRTFASNDDYGNPPPPLTGEIALRDVDRKAGIFFENGRIYAAQLEGFEPSMALRLLSTGRIEEEQFIELHALANEKVGPHAIAKQYVPAGLVEEINRQNLFSIMAHLYEWKTATWSWIDEAGTSDFIMTPLDSTLVITAADERVGQWNALLRNFPQATVPETILLPGPDWNDKAGQDTTPEIASILRYVDGTNTIGDIALLCGFSRFEMGARVARSIADGLVSLPQLTSDTDYDEGEGVWDVSGSADELEDAKLAMEQAFEAYQEAKKRYERIAENR